MEKLVTAVLRDDALLVQPTINSVGELCRQLDVPKHNALKLCNALQEVLEKRQAYAYAHTNRNGKFVVELSASAHTLRASVLDLGLPYVLTEDGLIFDGHTPSIDLSSLKDTEVAYGVEHMGHHGQMIYLETKLTTPYVAKSREVDDSPPLDNNFTIRKINADEFEIMEAIQCFYDEYGFTYSFDHLYNVEYFKKAISSQRFESFLIANQHGQVAGHQSFCHNPLFPGMWELASCVIRHKYRKSGIANMLTTDALQRAKAAAARALLVFPSAYHVGTQHIGASRGFVGTGIMPNYIQSNLATELNEKGTRLHLGVATYMFKKSEPIIIYPPATHQEFFDDRFRALDIEMDFGEPLEPREADTWMVVEVGNFLKASFLTALSVGRDFDELLTGQMRKSMLKRMELVVLLINLRDPACNHAFKSALEHGFHFMGGILGAEGVDYMIMQNFMGIPIMYETVKTKGDYTDIMHYCFNRLPRDLFI